jgi:hypothetical protein
MPQFAMARLQGLVERVPEVVRRDDARGAYRRQCAAFGAAEGVVAVAEPNVLPFGAARQADAVDEYVSRLYAFPLARVRATTTTSAELMRAAVASGLSRNSARAVKTR